jgi:hypothetical protein
MLLSAQENFNEMEIFVTNRKRNRTMFPTWTFTTDPIFPDNEPGAD